MFCLLHEVGEPPGGRGHTEEGQEGGVLQIVFWSEGGRRWLPKSMGSCKVCTLGLSKSSRVRESRERLPEGEGEAQGWRLRARQVGKKAPQGLRLPHTCCAISGRHLCLSGR